MVKTLSSACTGTPALSAGTSPVKSDSKRNKARGHIAKQAGKDFEAAIDVELTTLQQQGVIAYWERNKAGWRKTGPRWMPVEVSGADRFGVLSNGLAFALEVKSTGSTPGGKPKPLDLSRITDRQRLHLDATHRAGGCALLALEFRGLVSRETILVSWNTFCRLWPSAKSVHGRELSGSLWNRDHGYNFREAFKSEKYHVSQALFQALLGAL